MNIAFFASHNGSNMQAIINACKNGYLSSYPKILITNNPKSFAIERAKNEDLKYYCINSKIYPDEDDLNNKILQVLKENDINLIILAGYMKKISSKVIEKCEGRILNIHPALLPKYGGEGMYGNFVHTKVLENNEKFTGATVHVVNEEYDKGRILSQEKLEISIDDTVDTLSKKVLQIEHKLYVETIKKIEDGIIKL